MNEPRPTMRSIRPLEIRSRVANSWKSAHGIACAEDGHGAVEADRGRPGCGCGEEDRRGGVHEIVAVVLADAVGVETDLVGALDLFEQVLHALDGADVHAGNGVRDRRDEAVYADTH